MIGSLPKGVCNVLQRSTPPSSRTPQFQTRALAGASKIDCSAQTLAGRPPMRNRRYPLTFGGGQWRNPNYISKIMLMRLRNFSSLGTSEIRTANNPRFPDVSIENRPLSSADGLAFLTRNRF